MHLPLSKHISNQDLAAAFKFISGVLALKGADRFRVRAYDNAASVIASLEQPLHEMFLSNPDFERLPGIGPTLEKKLVELFTTGNIKAFQEYTTDMPGGMFALSQVHGIGVKRAYQLCHHFHLEAAETVLADVLALAQTHQIRDLDGFGEKSEADLLENLQHHTTQSRMPYEQARAVADQLIEQLGDCPGLEKVEALGSLRRHATSVGDIDLGLVVTDIGRVKNYVKTMKGVERHTVAGDNVIRIFLKSGEQIDMKTATPAEWGAFLQHYTGTKEHNIKLREFALKKGLSLSEHGIKETATGKLHTFTTEEAFYNFLGLKWIEPSQRLGGQEIDQAKL